MLIKQYVFVMMMLMVTCERIENGTWPCRVHAQGIRSVHVICDQPDTLTQLPHLPDTVLGWTGLHNPQTC